MKKWILGPIAFFMVVYAITSIFTSNNIGQTTNDILGGIPFVGDFLDGKSLFSKDDAIFKGIVTIAFAAILGYFFKTSTIWWGKIIEEVVITIFAGGIVSALISSFGSNVLIIVTIVLMILAIFKINGAVNIWVEVIKKAFVYVVVKAIFGGQL